jgi:hypothetical protein
MAKGTLISGIAASEHLDSSGERISIKGLDISSLERGEGVLNWEHKNENASQIVGKIIKAKKIFAEEDCEDENQTYFWSKCQAPFLYIVGELFDAVGHNQAQEIAAMVKYDAMKRGENPKAKNTVNFSIEGAKLEKDGAVITKSIARKTTLTVSPCNKMAIAEILPEQPVENQPRKQKNPLDVFKTEEAESVQLFKSETLEKTAPGSLSQGAALAPENLISRKKKAEEVSKTWPKFNKLVKFFMESKSLSKNEALAMAKVFALKQFEKAEKAISGMEKSWSPSQSSVGGKQIVSLSHPQHGVVSVAKVGDEYHVRHNGAVAGLKGNKGVFNNAKDAVGHMKNYTNALTAGTVAPKLMHNMSSGSAQGAPKPFPKKPKSI